jgi:hypothetical protein
MARGQLRGDHRLALKRKSPNLPDSLLDSCARAVQIEQKVCCELALSGARAGAGCYGGGGSGSVVATGAASAVARVNRIPPHQAFTSSTRLGELVVAQPQSERWSPDFIE